MSSSSDPLASAAKKKKAHYSKQNVPLHCEREPIHIVNRIQPCGTLLVVDSDLRVVQCSVNAVDMLPAGFAAAAAAGGGGGSTCAENKDEKEEESPAKAMGLSLIHI